LKLCQLHRDYDYEIKILLRILIIEFGASLEREDNNGIDVRKFLHDNDLFTEDDVYVLSRPKKRQRV